MKEKRNWRAIATWILFIFALLYVLPSFVGMPDWYPFKKSLGGGLDLEGGLELRYTVDWKKAVEGIGLKAGDSIRTRVVDELAKAQNENAADLPREKWDEYAKRVTYEATDVNVVRIQFADDEAAKIFDNDLVRQVDERLETSSAGGNAWDIILPDKEVQAVREQIVRETRDNIEKRVEAMGLIDPDVRIAGDADISVQIPGVDDTNQQEVVRQHLGKTAQLTMRFVDRAGSNSTAADAVFNGIEQKLTDFKAKRGEAAQSLEFVPAGKGGPYAFVKGKSKAELVRFFRTISVPKDHMIGYEHEEGGGKDSAESFWRATYLFDKVEINGSNLARAGTNYDDKGQPIVLLNLNSEGGRLFADATEKNVDEYLAILLDDDIASAPKIEEKIAGGRARITMGGRGSVNARMTEARALTQVLNQGAYQAPVYKVADNARGPSLGHDSISAGTTAFVLGSVLVIAFMILYYKISGLIAVAALLFNVLLIIMLLVAWNARLTLPGIAGIILTIGMAVDA
ncbi:MAG: protein translocase subunit SecD, partial [Myxococcales bacterium]|nr:protein translocase subunit SecD [Myxococcales bacterium]